MFSLKGKTALITGGGSGIGKAISLVFGSQGAMVHIIEINAEAAETVVDEIIEAGGKAEAHTCDISDQTAVLHLFRKLGRIDILINNAGIAHVGKAHTTPESDFDRIMRVNVKGAYNCLFAVLPIMQEQKSGVIINTSSIAAHVGLADRFVYSASKGAIHAMTISVARDYLDDNIRCNSISPARVHTPFVDGFIKKNYPGKEEEIFESLSKSQPIGRMGKPDEIAALVLYLSSEEASFITGTDFPIDGGFITLNT
jgi:NAD(P)-dependent dehydrogenase (short-subunit alcohol dehydrogenase family)